MPEIEIRPAKIEDISVLIQLTHHYRTPIVWQMDHVVDEGEEMITFRQARLPRPAFVEYPRKPEMLGRIWNEYSAIAVAELNGSMVGFMGISEDKAANSAWVKDLVVEEKFRRQGIGSALVLFGHAWSIQMNLRMIVLEMQSKNYPMIQLALKLGYRFSGYFDQYYPNQDIGIFFSKVLR